MARLFTPRAGALTSARRKIFHFMAKTRLLRLEAAPALPELEIWRSLAPEEARILGLSDDLSGELSLLAPSSPLRAFGQILEIRALVWSLRPEFPPERDEADDLP